MEHLPRLGNFAAAAAWRANIDASVQVKVDGGRLHLPTLGAAVVGEATGLVRLEIRNRVLVVEVAGRSVEVRPGDAGPNWLPLRRLLLGQGSGAPSFVIDDLDPLRDCFSSQPTHRLTEAEYAEWTSRGREAWSLLSRSDARTGDRVARWIHTLMPLTYTTEDVNLSISSRDALCSVALSLPPTPVDFAVALAHEHAHAMMNGLLLFVRVSQPDARKTYFAPWRSDARPVIGTIHGIFAFLAVAELWSRLSAVPSVRGRAEQQLAKRRLELRSAIEQVQAGDELTGAGRRLLEHCLRRLLRLESRTLNTTVQLRAEQDLRALRVAWEANNARAM